jgi:nucleotide-binding universal stress UspA family protein
VSSTEDYLESIQQALEAQDVKAQTEIRRGDVAEEILIFADKCDADMIVMATHGRQGLGRWVYGSVADVLLRRADCPLLIVRVDEEPDEQD